MTDLTPLQIFWLIIGLLVVAGILRLAFWILAALSDINYLKTEEWEE